MADLKDKAAVIKEASEKFAKENPDGLADIEKLMFMAGMPVVSMFLDQMVEYYNVSDESVLKEVKEFRLENGAIEFLCKGKKTKIQYEKCPKDHDLTAEFDKIKPHMTDEEWKAMLEEVSKLLNNYRIVWRKVAMARRDLIKKITNEEIDQFVDIKIDPSNTTLYLVEDWPNRVGIVVK